MTSNDDKEWLHAWRTTHEGHVMMANLTVFDRYDSSETNLRIPDFVAHGVQILVLRYKFTSVFIAQNGLFTLGALRKPSFWAYSIKFSKQTLQMGFKTWHETCEE